MKHLTAFCALFLLTILGKTQAFSQELHTQSNAAHITNESNATNGWTSNGETLMESLETTEAFSWHIIQHQSSKAQPNGSKFGGIYSFNTQVGESVPHLHLCHEFTVPKGPKLIFVDRMSGF